jgi:hypothetical protein
MRHQPFYLSLSAVTVIAGALASGPAGTYYAQSVAPEPAWQNAQLFIENYNPIQVLPFYFGFLLLAGFLLFFSSLPKPQTSREHIFRNLVVYSGGVYAFMISLNYLLQIAVLPGILNYPAMVELLASQNPHSLFWYIEMTGYGFLGLAGWFAAYSFHGKPLLTGIRYLLIANGVISLAGSVLTFVFPGWVMTMPGLVSYLAWNVLVILVMILVIMEYRFGMGKAGKEATRQPGTEAPRQQGSQPPRQQGGQGPRQQGNQAPRQQGNEATRQPGNQAPRQQGNEAPRQQGNEGQRRQGGGSQRHRRPGGPGGNDGPRP